jgi:uncharacterized membrane protein
MNIPRILSVVLLIALFAFAIAYYPSMPERMASHWNAQGVVDGWMGRFMGLFMLPIITLAVFFLLVFIPRFDPLRANVLKFQGAYDVFILVFILFFSYLEGLIVLANLGHVFNMVVTIIPALSVLFFALGFLMRKAKRNFFIGIRTPWTLVSDHVWEKTHKLGGILFVIVGLLNLLGLAFPRYAMLFLMGPIIAISLFLVVYSYAIREKTSSKNLLHGK